MQAEKEAGQDEEKAAKLQQLLAAQQWGASPENLGAARTMEPASGDESAGEMSLESVGRPVVDSSKQRSNGLRYPSSPLGQNSALSLLTSFLLPSSQLLRFACSLQQGHFLFPSWQLHCQSTGLPN